MTEVTIAETFLNELQEKTSQILDFLEQPEPGIFSWMLCLKAKVEEVKTLLNGQGMTESLPYDGDINLITDLREHFQPIQALLANREPGLISWHTALRRALQKLTNLLSALVD